jgi:glycosyltransferase involved in cell wall biosynthesis
MTINNQSRTEYLNSISLTIIIPTLNCSNTLPATLASLVPLIKRGARIIVVDSYSKDETIRIAEQFGVDIVYAPPGNMYVAINIGINLARTDWVGYLNGDDLIYADAVLQGLEKFYLDADVIYGSIDFIDIAGRFLHSWNSPHHSDIQALATFHINAIPQQGAIFRRAMAIKLGGFSLNSRYTSDYDFFLRAKLNNFRFKKLDVPRIAAFRVHSDQMSQHRRVEMRTEAVYSNSVNKIKVGWFSRYLALSKLRITNWDSYMLRLIRSRHNKSVMKVHSSIEL